jgi:hypothetical protein
MNAGMISVRNIWKMIFYVRSAVLKEMKIYVLWSTSYKERFPLWYYIHKDNAERAKAEYDEKNPYDPAEIHTEETKD